MKLLKHVSGITFSGVLCLFIFQANAQDLQADNMLLFQRKSGGWSKQYHGKAFSYNVQFSDSLKADIAVEASHDDANIDNNSTTKEIAYLVKSYHKFNNPKYLAAAENGIRFLLKAQYKNGGWPQYYPDHSGYRGQITFNDNAMANVLVLLQDVALRRNGMEAVNSALVAPTADAVQRGLDCILKTQIRVEGQLTGWCQQYDRVTLQPTKARAYELPSISGSESVSIVKFLMSQPSPTREMKDAIHGAVNWLKKVKIADYKVVTVSAPGTPGGIDRKVVADPSAPGMWARYYEIGTNKPFFCDRDGIKKYSIAEIGYERRVGYAWFGKWAAELLERHYPAWVTDKG
jgi:PelA/Pel-15E family pectate lyase